MLWFRQKEYKWLKEMSLVTDHYVNFHILGEKDGGGTWPIFGFWGTVEGLKHWPCLGQKFHDTGPV